MFFNISLSRNDSYPNLKEFDIGNIKVIHLLCKCLSNNLFLCKIYGRSIHDYTLMQVYRVVLTSIIDSCCAEMDQSTNQPF